MILRNSLKPSVLCDPLGGEGGGPLNADQQAIARATATVAASQTAEPAPKASGGPRPVKPILTAPPAKALEGSFDVSADSDLPEDIVAPAKTPSNPATTKAVEAVIPKVPKTEPKSELKTEPKVETAKATAQIKVTEKAGARDYSGFSDEDVAVLKQMSNPAFEIASKRFKELNELRNRKPDSYLQHPKAYTLSPEYQDAVETSNAANFEAEHYKQQLLNIRQGKKWTRVLGYRQNGQPVYSEAQVATDEAEIEVDNVMKYALGIANQTQTKLEGLKGNFEKQVNNSNQAIQEERARRFEWVSKPELMEKTIDVAGVGETPIKKIIGDFKGLFANHHQSSPVLDVAADLFVAVQWLSKQLREAQAQVSKEQQLKSQVLQAEPAVEGGGNTNTAKDDVFSTEGLPE